MGGEGEGALRERKCLMLVRYGKVHRYVGRVLDAKELREAEERAAEEANEKRRRRVLTGAPLEYYNKFSNSDGVGATATIVHRDGDGGADYGFAPPSVAGASNGACTNIRGGNGSRRN